LVGDDQPNADQFDFSFARLHKRTGVDSVQAFRFPFLMDFSQNLRQKPLQRGKNINPAWLIRHVMTNRLSGQKLLKFPAKTLL